MVKLIFKPEDKDGNFTSSLTSKKVEKNLNPLKDISIDLQKLTINENTIENKYVLKSTKDIVGLENCAYVLKEWYYKSLKDKNNKCLLIIGPTGCGKTSLVELFSKEENINLYTIKQSENIKTKKDLLKEIYLFSEYCFFKKQENKLILIDEYQNGQYDLLSVSDIINLLMVRNGSVKERECSYIPPILIISSDSKGSKLSEIKKVSDVYYINEINLYYINEWLKSIDIDVSEIKEIIEMCKSDKRLLINTISFFKNKSDFINLPYKDTDINLFEFVDILFQNNEKNINDVYKYYETDGYSISNLVHENYIDYGEDIHTLAKVANAISYGELLFSDTYESNKTFIPDAHFINSIYIPSFYLKTDKINKNIRTSCMNNRYNIYLNNKKIISKVDKDILFILFVKKFLNHGLIKTKVLNTNQEHYLRNILFSLGKENNIEKLELIYKHFSEFKDTNIKETKTKNFTLKFKEKLKKIEALYGRIN